MSSRDGCMVHRRNQKMSVVDLSLRCMFVYPQIIYIDCKLLFAGNRLEKVVLETDC